MVFEKTRGVCLFIMEHLWCNLLRLCAFNLSDEIHEPVFDIVTEDASSGGLLYVLHRGSNVCDAGTMS